VPSNQAWANLQLDIITCDRCPRLRTHCQAVAAEKRAAFREWDYWGKPLPNLGDASARLLVVGLAPAAHGGNRTGRIFTGDESGRFLFAALHAAGLANQAESIARGDGLELSGAFITATARCAPPDNKPLPIELDHCREYLAREIEALDRVKVVLALGRIGFDAFLKARRDLGRPPVAPKPEFGHGVASRMSEGVFLLASYHPSQQNTSTGKLTVPMWRSVFTSARKLRDRL